MGSLEISREELDRAYPSMQDEPTREEREDGKSKHKITDDASAYGVKVQDYQAKYHKLSLVNVEHNSDRLLKIMVQELAKEARAQLSGKASDLEVKAAIGLLEDHYKATPSVAKLRDDFVIELGKVNNLAQIYLNDVQKAQAKFEEYDKVYPGMSLSPLEIAAGGEKDILDSFDDDPPEDEGE